MNFINAIKKETIIICNDSFKKKFLKEKKLTPIKFMNLSEFVEKMCFSYDERAILYTVNKYHVKYEVANTYIKNLYYIDNIDYNIPKLDFLVKLKRELDDSNLLTYNNNFKKYIKNTDIIIYGIRITGFFKKILQGLEYKVIERKYRNYEHSVYEFPRMEEEIEYVAHSISELIYNGIDINKIKLTNVDSSYHNTIERIFSLFNLKVSIEHKVHLSSFQEVKEFIKTLKNNDIEFAIEQLDKNNEMYHEILKVINKYIKYNDKDLLIYKLENSHLTDDKYTNIIEIVDYLEYVSDDDEYIFMIGFNDSLIPKNVMDTEYITDNIKKYVSIDDTRIVNKFLKEDTLKAIYDIKNLIITYKLSDFKHTYYPSILCNKFNVIKVNNYSNTSYSNIYDRIKLVKRYDDYFKYGYKSDDFSLLNNNYSIKYNSFSNEFTGIERQTNKLKLSYSKMQTYNKCQFRYYLSSILKLDIFEENFSTIIGRMVHFVMEKCLSDNNTDIDKYLTEFIGDNTFTKKELFFLEKYRISIKELLNQVLLEKEYSLFNEAMYEKEIVIDFGDNVEFVGIIDKILYYKANNTTYVCLIDYKTGSEDISLNYLKYGINIQLPIYLYLSTKLDFNNIKYTGFYLQKLNINDKDYRLVGYSNSDKDILSIIDKNYDNSKIIKGLKTNKDGSFSKNSKTLSNDDIDKIKESVHNQIINVIDNIKNNQFNINPKVNNDKNISCEFCQFKDICFMTKKDEIKIFPQEFGGDE